MKSLPILLICIAAMLVLTACGDNETNYPIGDGGWFIAIDVGRIPNGVTEYPILVDVEVEILNLDNGNPAADGSLVRLRVTPGSFDNDLPEIEKTLVDGQTTATLVISSPGSYDLEVEYPEGDSCATTCFSVGL